jgi:hypothetical protein
MVKNAKGEETMSIRNGLRHRIIIDRPTIVTIGALAIAAPRLVRIASMIPSDMLPMAGKPSPTSTTWDVTDPGLPILYDVCDALSFIFPLLEIDPVREATRSIAIPSQCRKLIDAYEAPYMGFTPAEKAEVIPAIKTIATWTTRKGENSFLLSPDSTRGLLRSYCEAVRDYMERNPRRFLLVEHFSGADYKKEHLVSRAHLSESSNKPNVQTGDAPDLAEKFAWIRHICGGAINSYP